MLRFFFGLCFVQVRDLVHLASRNCALVLCDANGSKSKKPLSSHLILILARCATAFCSFIKSRNFQSFFLECQTIVQDKALLSPCLFFKV